MVPAAPLSVDELAALAVEAGLDDVGIAPAEPFSDTRAILESRRRGGLAGGMQFTYRNPERSTTPTLTWPWARSLVVGALGYWRPTPAPPAGLGPLAAVARYAREDHYAVLRDALDVVADRLRDSGWRAQVVADDNALVDRAAAVRAGIGWYGKNANVLLPGRGSWFVLGAVVTDAPLTDGGGDGSGDAVDPVPDGCGTCRRCLDGCPTGAIIAPGVVDARRCLAWMVQAEGPFPVEFRQSLGDRLYGCDQCQEVCPPSRVDVRRAHGEGREGGDGPHEGGGSELAWVPVLDVLDADDEVLLARYGRWYIPRRDPRYLRRNALVVLGNSGAGDDSRVVAALGRYVAHPDPLLAEHAAWAARALGRDDLLPRATA